MENPTYSEENHGVSAIPLTTSSAPTSDESAITAPLTDEELRAACRAYVKDFCCYGSRFLREMNLTEIQNVCAFHYKLESLGEKRESIQKTVIYQGEHVDTSGEAPDPWDVRVATTDGMFEFKEHQVTILIPHTTYLSNCTKCFGHTKRRCESCDGRGESSCCNCNGRGRVRNHFAEWWESRTSMCIWCLGTGTKSCWTCNASGQVKCKACKQGKMKNYKELIVTWKPHVDDFVSNTQNVPKELILRADGREIFSERANLVHPVNLPYDRSVNEASSYFISKHSTSFTDEQIIAQEINELPNKITPPENDLPFSAFPQLASELAFTKPKLLS
ncbi:Protein SSUH2 [Araneus ventricosus]|uniref:Protein SSUH2 n=1 Tax=Araneus ventricosus TaxID=182803 RepID=A0A4Y2CTG2_ARAVE|nr:Protein SSUH2 [Araneus ventricosus]GBM07700.1 Protein SSUH2 [Araneus ventricosus]